MSGTANSMCSFRYMQTSYTQIFVSFQDGNILHTSYIEHFLHTYINNKNFICVVHFKFISTTYFKQ